MSLNHNRRVRLPYRALHVEPHWWSDGVNTSTCVLINIGVSGGIHHCNIFSAFFRTFCQSQRLHPPPPPRRFIMVSKAPGDCFD